MKTYGAPGDGEWSASRPGRLRYGYIYNFSKLIVIKL
jgi:hypothetical protein